MKDNLGWVMVNGGAAFASQIGRWLTALAGQVSRGGCFRYTE
jgi:hypothetical protein